MTFDLTPTELTTLNATGSVRVVRVCDPKPDGVINGHPGQRKMITGLSGFPTSEWSALDSPFPPAGTREVIDGVDCVWGEVECKQASQIEMQLDIDGPILCAEFLTKYKADDYIFTTTVRKDTE